MITDIFFYITIITAIIFALLITLSFAIRDLNREIKQISTSVETIHMRLENGEEEQ
jgi:hypothetical protein